MSEKVVVIYVSREFRDKVKVQKHELTYEKFLDNLLEKSPENRQISQANTKKTHLQKGDS